MKKTNRILHLLTSFIASIGVFAFLSVCFILIYPKILGNFSPKETDATAPADTAEPRIDDNNNVRKNFTGDSIVDETEPQTENALDFNISFSDTYPNDATGNWRLATTTENTDIMDYVIDYYKTYFKSDSEIHVIINFSLNTTTSIMAMGNLLYVTTTEYVDNEEHDAKLACSGMLLSEYCVNIDTGEIEKIQ